jgi:predicted peptidase
MKCTIPFLLLLVCSQVYARQKATVRYNYLLYVPKSYSTTNKRFPLLVYLHGGSQKGNDLNKLKTYGLPYLIDQGHNYNFIVASPQCPEGKYWSTENWFDSLYLELRAKYRIDTNRIYVTGISIGGFGAWQVAMDHPNTFAAIMPLCGGCNDSTHICRISHVPVWTFHGTADNMIDINETERLVNRLQLCNGKVRFTRLEGEGHGIQYLYEKQELYDWLLRQRRK